MELLPALLCKCKTDNGVFGVEVRSIDIELFGEQFFFDAMNPDPLYLYLWRDNLVAQGITLYRAVVTGKWHSNDGRTEIGPIAHDAAGTKEWIEHILKIENDNLSLLCKRGVSCRFLHYEDIVQPETATLTAFSQPLGRAVLPSEVAGEANRPSRMADEWNRGVEQCFRDDLAEFVRLLHPRRLIKKLVG